MNTLTLKNVTKKYGRLTALNNFTYTFTNGVYGILGPNGAGKSTLMNIITRSIGYNDGEILFNDRNIKSIGNTFLSNIGYMPQQQELYEDMTLIHFLYYISSLKGLKKKNAEVEIENVIKQVHLDDYKNRKFRNMSGGMKQRALIAQAILGNPNILILDEPTAGLDPKERIRIRNLIADISSDKIVLVSTHVVSDIEFIAGNVIFINKGNIIRSGAVSTLCSELDNYIYEALVKHDLVHDLEKKYKVSALFSLGDMVKVRIISDSMPEGGIKCIPSLEDLYLYLFE